MTADDGNGGDGNIGEGQIKTAVNLASNAPQRRKKDDIGNKNNTNNDNDNNGTISTI